MYYFQYPVSDTTIYEGNLTSSLNAGQDEILEVQKIIDKTGTIVQASRILIKFDYTDIIRKRNSNTIPADAKYYLNLYDAGSTELKTEQSLHVYMISGSWNQGSGFSTSNPTVEDGASWKYRGDSTTANYWLTQQKGLTLASGSLTILDGDYDNQDLLIGTTEFTFVSGSPTIFNDSSTQIFVESGSTTGSSVNNLRDAINNNSTLHNLPISASVLGSNPDKLILSGSSIGTLSNLGAASSSNLFSFDGNKISALEGGTSETSEDPTDGVGGTWFTASYSNQYNVSSSFDLVYGTTDLRIDVTDLVNNQILSSSFYGNNGFILKREHIPTSQSLFTAFDPATATGSAEHNTEHLGNLKFFSKETHTIYPPKIEVEWDDSQWNTGSLDPLSSTDLERLNVYFKGIKPEYKEKSKTKFRLVGRELYPTRGFGTTPSALTVKYLPSGSRALEQGTYYSVKDASTDEVIIPFSTGSIVSCDSQGNYFNIWMDTFQPERFYKFEIKVVSGSGVDQTSMIYDEGYEFKVVR